MEKNRKRVLRPLAPNVGILGLVALVLALAAGPGALAYDIHVTVQGVGSSGNPSGFRWLVEEDNTDQSAPGVSVNNSIGVLIHKSYAPVVASGHASGNTATITVPDGKWYFVSVLPDSGFTIAGTTTLVDPQHPFAFPVGTVNLTIMVNPEPLPTAQIWLFAHVDHNSINNVPDGGEPGLGGFSVIIKDDAGQVTQDAFGNPLGTQYDIAGNVTVMGAPAGYIQTMTEADVGNPVKNPYGLAVGEALIKYLPPGKYGTQVIPPTGTPWIQTATIEGTEVVDAWVKPGEPRAFTEGFGTGSWHAFYGFVNPTATNYTTSTDTRLPWLVTPPAGTGSITGTLRYNHFGAPPNNQMNFGGDVVGEAWVGLNDPATGQGLYAVQANQNTGTFTIPNVPPGTYQLVWWDKPLDALFGFQTVVVPPGGGGTGAPVALGEVLVFRWFGTHEGSVFWDDGGPTHIASHVANGFRDPEEAGIENEILNLRYRDGRIYQSTTTDLTGEYSFSEVFPFFKWLVAELDYTRYKPTGMTAVSDAGGPFAPHAGWGYPSFDKLTPQPQTSPNSWLNGTTPALTPLDNYWTGNNLSRTENSLPTSTPGGTGATFPFLLQAIQNYLNQTTYIDWGKTLYDYRENGGISGMVYYVVTAAENDPQLAAGEPWEPGIPRAVINLYRDVDNNGVIDDVNGSGFVELSDADNYPFGDFPGLGDVDYNGDSILDSGDAVQTATTDSWDDNPPTDCHQILPDLPGGPPAPCFDNYGTWNQVRDGVFDGGYAFTSYFPEGISGAGAEVALYRGYYIVEAVTPPGYLVLKEENKNVDFGDEYVPGPGIIPPVCVGTEANMGPNPPDGQPRVLAGGSSFVVPAELTLFPGVEAPFAGMTRPFCNLRKVKVSDGFNAAANFWALTEVPKASRCVGFVNNDLSAEFNAASPIFGEKASPSWIPCSFKDWAGNEILRVYSDEYGAYSALLPSSFTKNVVTPTGVAPNLITVCLNDPLMPSIPGNPNSPRVPDPRYDPNYAQVCWTLQYTPGATTYLDTPIVPVGAFVGYPYTAVDIEPAAGTPEIASVNGPTGGPVVCNSPANGDVITITSPGTVAVTNPQYNPTLPGPPTNPWNVPTVNRDYGFGPYATGLSKVSVGGVDLTIVNPADWTNLSITATVPAGVTTGAVVVTRGDTLRSSTTGVTLHVLTPAECASGVRRVSAAPYPATPIQDAIDAANACDLILVGPGTYDENPIVYKPLKLQGAGESTVINAQTGNTNRLDLWHQKVRTLLGTPGVDPYAANEAPGFMVIGDIPPGNGGIPFPTTAPGNQCALIDGFLIQGAQGGGGIYVDDLVHYLQISANKIKGNQGSYGGGITVGTPDVESSNTYITIRNNEVVKNGGITGGGAVSFYSGSDHYTVSRNLLSANLTRQSGGGILHEGLSDFGTIDGNKILFNEVFFGGQLGGDGGGIFVGGSTVAGVLGPGAGNVDIVNNLIQGNLAGSGFGGGIRAWAFNGTDVSAGGSATYELNLFNNMIVNNVAANSGGGVSLQDTAKVNIVNNTIADNDSTATAISTFAAGSANSTPQGAGLVGNYHSLVLRNALAAAGDPQTFANPRLEDCILWHNRSHYYDPTLNGSRGGLVLNPAFPPNGYWDLQVANTPAPQSLNPQYCVLSTTAGYAATNVSTDPLFVREYANDLLSAKVTDEGGNNISVRYSPIDYAAGDYHLSAITSGAFNLGRSTASATYPALLQDYDRQARPYLVYADSGADEHYPSFIPGVLAPAQDLRLINPAAGTGLVPVTTTFSWQEPSGVDAACLPLSYDLLRSLSASDFSAATCVASDLVVTTASDSSAPVPGQVLYFLVRDKSALCGESMGTTLDGAPRTAGACHE
jgi:hypothetical protein